MSEFSFSLSKLFNNQCIALYVKIFHVESKANYDASPLEHA